MIREAEAGLKGLGVRMPLVGSDWSSEAGPGRQRTPNQHVATQIAVQIRRVWAEKTTHGVAPSQDVVPLFSEKEYSA